MSNRYFVLAFYQFSPISDPLGEVVRHQAFFQGLDVTSRIYISEGGINGQMSALASDAERYMQWMHSRPEFQAVHFKIHTWHEQVFPRATVKYRSKLVAIDETIDMAKTAAHLSPQEWQQRLESGEDKIVLDVRNDYEWEVGHFDGAELPPCETFREFDQYAEELKHKKDPKTTPVMMYCTGGIRCELYSALLKERGFEKVFQLQGGIINYGLEVGSKHWKGKLFVFDDRLAVPISEEKTAVVGKCRLCDSPSEAYYNCANMDCNRLFLCCPSCLEKHIGCCQEACKKASRVRPYQQQNPHKPFRRQKKCGLAKKKLPAGTE